MKAKPKATRRTSTSSEGETLSTVLRRALADRRSHQPVARVYHREHGGAINRAPVVRRSAALPAGELGPALRDVVAEHRRSTHALSHDVVAVIEEHKNAMRLQAFAMIAGEITRQEGAAALEAFVASRARPVA